jgi:hypothetical protein
MQTAVTADLVIPVCFCSGEYASVSTITPQSCSPVGCRFTSRQPIRSGATCTAGRAKKGWGRAGRSLMGVVAMGVALWACAEEC